MTYGLIGEHLPYSFSKIVHERLGDYKYELFCLNESQFEQMLSERKFDGVNITIPYKKKAMLFCDEVSKIAQEIGSVNTIYKKDGKFIGTNTDYNGILYSLKRTNISFKNKKVLILGAGGTSLTVQKCALDEGASNITVARRGHDFSLDQDAEIIVNATPVGTFPNNGDKLINLSDFPRCEGVLDVIYNPLSTELVLRAKEYGIPCCNGLPMLVAQATAAAEFFMGKEYQHKNEEIIEWVTDSIKNLVLIGMPGSGKTTIGKEIAKELNRTFVDLDEAIVTKAGMSIPQIFEANGEEFFRNLETEVCKEYGKQKNLVIATGGGVVLRQENMDALMQNGEVFFLDRDIKNLAMDGRPLSSSFETIKRMHEERLPLYKKYSDYVIACNENIA